MVSLKKVLVAVLAVLTISMCVPSVSLAYEEVTGRGIVTADSLNVRSGPGKEYDLMGKVYRSNEIDIVGIDGDWLKIDYNNSEGYVSGEYVKYELQEVEEVVQEEEQLEEPEVFEENETEDEPVYNYKLIFGIVGVIIVLIVMILGTIKSIKNLDSEDDDYEEDEEDEYEDTDEYDEDDYEDDDEDDEYEDDDDDEEDDEDEYEYVMVKRPKQKQTQQSSIRSQTINKSQTANRSQATGKPQAKPVKKSDDYSIDIDPIYFD